MPMTLEDSAGEKKRIEQQTEARQLMLCTIHLFLASRLAVWQIRDLFG